MVVLELIQEFLNENGIYSTTAARLHTHLQTKKSSNAQYSELKVPCLSSLRRVLKEHFHLRFGKSLAANIKYRDPEYNEKRLWVSRLLS